MKNGFLDSKEIKVGACRNAPWIHLLDSPYYFGGSVILGGCNSYVRGIWGT